MKTRTTSIADGRIRALVLVLVFSSVLPALGFRPFSADPETLVAVGGYDVVAYVEEGKAVEGAPIFFAKKHGVYWRFRTKEHLRKFKANPEKYLPRFGGYCAFSMAEGEVSRCDPRLFALHEGKLYVFGNREMLNQWKRNPGRYIREGRIVYQRLLADTEAAASEEEGADRS